ncbi:MaoC family dehydratase [Aromatoleum aromaticum]|uniref:MaoC family dehydratase n=1 Tax=Aromatoleum aromaticum TaxID=551760 RepID=UPI001459651F|nr:MaoC family dehydratase [Aromatoleum aromaticum]NMG56354.1 MaoC family dehydratase [Aromatoleum aromaticum]
MAGLYFDEFQVDQVFRHEIRRTVTEADNIWFCAATYNPAQIHIDADYCANTEFGRPLVNSVFTLGLVIGLSVQDTTLGTTVANLGMTDVKFPAPVFAGDTLKSVTTVLNVRESASRPAQGIVTFRHEGFNQRGDLVATCQRQALMHKRRAQ